MEPNSTLKIMCPGRITKASIALFRTFLIVISLAPLVAEAEAESGLASYYGYSRGHRGEMTCAHRTRPFGRIITVSYPGRSIRGGGTDTGRFIRAPVMDMSVSGRRRPGLI